MDNPSALLGQATVDTETRHQPCQLVAGEACGGRERTTTCGQEWRSFVGVYGVIGMMRFSKVQPLVMVVTKISDDAELWRATGLFRGILALVDKCRCHE
jgi:hypothetical protein